MYGQRATIDWYPLAPSASDAEGRTTRTFEDVQELRDVVVSTIVDSVVLGDQLTPIADAALHVPLELAFKLNDEVVIPAGVQGVEAGRYRVTVVRPNRRFRRVELLRQVA